WINGKSFKPIWTSSTNWSLVLPVDLGANNLVVTATDRIGNAVGTNAVTANSSFSPENPVGNVVINELMYHPQIAGAEFIELYNRATNTTFDLSGWQLSELNYQFPIGATLAPGQYLVLAGSRTAFVSAYESAQPAFDRFTGTLNPAGQILTLANSNGVVAQFRFEATAPWPTNAANIPGVSLQLVDAAQDQRRVANWKSALPDGSQPTSFTLLDFTNAWTYQQTANLDAISWTATNYDDSGWSTGPGVLAFENNPALVNLIGTTLNPPVLPTNDVTAGHAFYFRTSLPVNQDLSGYFLKVTAYLDDGMVLYVNGAEIKRIRMNTGTDLNINLANAAAMDADGDATVPDTFLLPASTLILGTNIIAASVHQQSTNSLDIVFGLKIEAIPRIAAYATPGQPNNVATNLPAFPPLWLNEVQLDNLTGPTDNAAEHEPWVEIYNAGTNSLDLTGYYLQTNYDGSAAWAFPAGTTVTPGQFRVIWLDGQTAQTSGTNLHADFRLQPGIGKLALTRTVANAPQIVDYLNYEPLTANFSYGDFPDAQPLYRQAMFQVTPGAANNNQVSPIAVMINEWMAENTSGLTNAATGKFDDWFELYNPLDTPADLTGYYLTDTLSLPFQYQIPAGFVVPAHGFLLVWADDKVVANTNTSTLHVPFKLSKSGEAIGLFNAAGSAIDAVVFNAQTANLSEGRYPDGGTLRLFMPTASPGQPNIVPPASGTPNISNLVANKNGNLSFRFPTSPGHTYRVEYKNELSNPNWLPLGSDYFATGYTASLMDNTSNQQRYYRVSLIQ
ncbi:MAG TPA: lamin tail domain-containing protein, partial [Verrucomicrobiae bacterium]